MTLTPEDSALVALCRVPFRKSLLASAELSTPAFAWDSFFERAARWEIEPATMFNLRNAFSDNLSQDVLTKVEEIEARSRSSALSLALLAVNIIKTAEQRGIPSILLKGAALGAFAYGDPSLRTSSDIDLLVRREDTKGIRESLEECGFVRDYPGSMETSLLDAGHALELSRGGVKVEIHSSLMSRYLRLNFPLDEVWMDSISLMCVNEEIRVLSPSHLSVYLAVHAAKHEWPSLRLLCDLAQLGSRLSDVDRLGAISLAERLHARRIMEITDELLSFFFDEPLFDQSNRLLQTVNYGKKRANNSINNAVVHALRRLGVQQVRSADGIPSSLRDSPMSRLLFWTSLRERLRDKLGSFALLALQHRVRLRAEANEPARR